MSHSESDKILISRIEELEYRISILESFIDKSGVLLGRHDISENDAMRIAIKKDLKSRGYDVGKFKNRLGAKFYIGE